MPQIETVAENVYIKAVARLMMVVLIPVLGWAGNNTYSALSHMEELLQKEDVAIALLQQQVLSSQHTTDDRFQNTVRRLDEARYSPTDASRDFALRDQRFVDVERRLDKLERNAWGHSDKQP